VRSTEPYYSDEHKAAVAARWDGKRLITSPAVFLPRCHSQRQQAIEDAYESFRDRIAHAWGNQRTSGMSWVQKKATTHVAGINTLKPGSPRWTSIENFIGPHEPMYRFLVLSRSCIGAESGLL
jgi:hypothetical protein